MSNTDGAPDTPYIEVHPASKQPIVTQSADGVSHEFPPDTKPEIVDKAMKAYAEEHKDKTTTLGQMGRGFMDPIEGGAQLLENLTPAPIERGVNAVNNAIADKTGMLGKLPPGGMNERLKQREQQIQQERGSNTGMDWPRMIGGLLNPVNYVGSGVGLEMRGLSMLPRITGFEAVKAGTSGAERLAVAMEKGELGGAAAAALEPATKKDYWTEKATQIGVGALAGGALGAAFGGASNALLGIGEYLARNHPDNIASQAVQKVLDRIKTSEKSGGPTATQMLDLVNAAKKPGIQNPRPQYGLTLADTGSEGVQQLAGHVARQPGEGRDIARKFLRERDEQAAKRLDADIGQHLHGSGETAFQSFKALLGARSAASRPAYEATHELQNVWSPRLQEFLDAPDVKKGLARGYEIERNLALAEGRPITASQMGVDIDTQGNIKMLSTPNMRLLDMAKQGLDAMIADTRDPITGRLSQYGVSLDKVRRAYINEMDNLDTKGIYKNARQTWAGYSASLDALELGKSVFTANPEEFASQIAELSPANQEFMRIGVAAKLREKLLKTGLHGDEAKALIKNPWTKQQLRPAFKSDAEFNAFADAVTEETSMFENARKFVGGSQTGERVAEDAAEGSPLATLMSKMALGHWGSAIKDAYQIFRAVGLKPNPEVNAKIAKILFSTNVEPDIGVLLRGGHAPPRMNPAAGAAGAVQGVGTAAAPMAAIDLTKERSPQRATQ